MLYAGLILVLLQLQNGNSKTIKTYVHGRTALLAGDVTMVCESLLPRPHGRVAADVPRSKQCRSICGVQERANYDGAARVLIYYEVSTNVRSYTFIACKLLV